MHLVRDGQGVVPDPGPVWVGAQLDIAISYRLSKQALLASQGQEGPPSSSPVLSKSEPALGPWTPVLDHWRDDRARGNLDA